MSSPKNQNLPRWKRSFPSGLKDPIRKRPASNGAWLFDSVLSKSFKG